MGDSVHFTRVCSAAATVIVLGGCGVLGHHSGNASDRTIKDAFPRGGRMLLVGQRPVGQLVNDVAAAQQAIVASTPSSDPILTPAFNLTAHIAASSHADPLYLCGGATARPSWLAEIADSDLRA